MAIRWKWKIKFDRQYIIPTIKCFYIAFTNVSMQLNVVQLLFPKSYIVFIKAELYFSLLII